jgi:predicted nucleotidyltransferase
MNISLKKNEKKALQFFAKRIRRIFGARLVLLKLYGSAARGERWEESDIDILVLIDKLTWKEKIKVWDEATNINIEFDTLLSPLVMTPEEFKVLRDRERRIALDIEKEGIVYEYKK